MSGPKSASYSVVSPEELERRRLAAACDRLARVNQQLDQVQRELAALGAKYDSVEIHPAPATASGSEVEQLSEAREEQLVTLHSLLIAARTSAFVRSLSVADVAAGLIESVVSGRAEESGLDTSGATIDKYRSRAKERLRVAAEKLDGLALSGLAARVDALDEVMNMTQAKLAMSQFSFELQAAVKLADEKSERRTRRGELIRELDGLVGGEVDEARTRLMTEANTDAPTLDAAAVAAIAKRARERADEEFVGAAVTRALTDMGYTVVDEMSVSVPEQGVLVELPGSSNHLLRVRENAGRLQTNVVRIDPTGARNAVGDAAAERVACEVFGTLRAEIQEQGVELSMERADDPGQTPVQVMRTRPALTAIRKGTRESDQHVMRERGAKR